MGIARTLATRLFALGKLKNTILFESHGDFCDNSRELFEYMLSIHLNERWKMVWLMRDRKRFKETKLPNVKFISLFPVTLWDKIQYKRYLAQARFAFYTHQRPEFKLNRGETYVNLWHGAGPKRPTYIDIGANFDYVLYSSDIFKEAFVNYFSCKESQLLPLGNPRNDLLFKPGEGLSKIISRSYRKVIIWMPTFRVSSTGRADFVDVENQNHGLPIVNSDAKLKELDAILSAHDMLLIVKTHPMEDLSAINMEGKENILLLTNRELDSKAVFLYTLLKDTDALITDVSSVYVDYLLLDKPIGFTVDDLGNYKTGYIFEEPLLFMPGAHILDFDDFRQFVLDVAEEKDVHAPQRANVNRLLNKYQNGHFSKRIVEHFHIS